MLYVFHSLYLVVFKIFFINSSIIEYVQNKLAIK